MGRHPTVKLAPLWAAHPGLTQRLAHPGDGLQEEPAGCSASGLAAACVVDSGQGGVGTGTTALSRTWTLKLQSHCGGGGG